MPWFDPLVGGPFIDWLRAAAHERYTPQVPGDPFATSMRDFDDVAPDLKALSVGNSVNRQRVTDLRNARLILPGADKLSSLGQAVLDGWNTYGVADDSYGNELPRQLILVCEALVAGEAFYLGLADFWKSKADLYGEDTLVDQWQDLFLLTYFSKTLNSFCPMEHVEKSGSKLPTWNKAELQGKIASMVPPGDSALEGLKRILDTVEGLISRGKARKVFLVAMLLALAPEQAHAKEKLATWTLPLTSSSRPEGHSTLPTTTQTLCLSILAAYESKLISYRASGTTPDHFDIVLKRKNVILFGPPGTGKTFSAQRIADYWRGTHGTSSVINVTFHPTYSYEDFVWGWRPDYSDGTKFLPQRGVLLEACEIAASGIPTLLVIDEINRADTARVFGELITFIEADKRGIPFRLAQEPTTERSIPPNLFVLGTMNTADRSISLLDVALRRRFAFIEFAPDPAVFGKNKHWSSHVQGVDLAALMESINSRLLNVGVESDRAIGHALFGVTSDTANALPELRDRIEFDIYPLVVDYCFSDRSRVAEVLGPLVDPSGRLRRLSDTELISSLNGFGTSASADTHIGAHLVPISGTEESAAAAESQK